MRLGLLISLLVFMSCLDIKKTLPASTGSLSEVVFVVEDQLWKEKIEKLVQQTFGATILGLSKKETNYNIIQINKSEFQTIFKTHKNIIIIDSNLSGGSEQNKWAKGQSVFFLNSNKKANQSIEELIKAKYFFDIKELEKIKQKIKATSNKKAEASIKAQFDINIVVPKEYIVIKDSSNLFWATYNPEKKEEIKQLIIFSFIPKTNNIRNEVLSKTDSVYSKYLVGSTKNAYVRIENQYKPFFRKDLYRGLWKLENGFMGGPFLIKTYAIEEKIIVITGIIFAPKNRKRDYIKTLEATI